MTKTNHSRATPKAIFSGFVKLLRPVNAVMSMIGVFIGYSLATNGIHLTRELFLAMLAVFFISGAGQAINDYFDYAIDRKRKSTRPMASGLIDRRTGLVYALALFVLGTVLASFINDSAFFMAGFFSLLLLAYSASMSKIKFAGNVIVSLSVAFTYIFGATAATLTPLVVMVAIPAFFGNWAREIIKDIEDEKEDKGHKLTLPHVLKKHHLHFFVLAILAFGILLSYLPTLFAHANIFFTVAVTVSNLVFILAAKQLLAKDAESAAATTKRAMLVGLVAQLALLL